MATPPRVGTVECSRAIDIIAKRRTKVDDPDRHLLPDNPEEPQVREVLDYLAAHSSPARIPRWVLHADCHDALTLTTWLWWDDRRRERTWLRRSITEGLFLSEIAGHFGMSSRQGVRDRLDRLDALLRYDRPDEKLARSERRADLARRVVQDVEQAWITKHADELAELVETLDVQACRFGLTGGANDDDSEDAGSDRDWLDEAVKDARDGAWTPASMRVLGLAADEVATCPGVLALDSTRPYGVHRVLERVAALRSEFAGLR